MTTEQLSYQDLAVATADLISVETLKVYSQVCHRVDVTHLEANLALVETFQASFRLSTYRITQLKPMPVTEQDLVMLKYLALAAVAKAKAKAAASSLDNYLMPILAQATDLNSLLHAIWCHDQADVIVANLAEGLFDDDSIIAGAHMDLSPFVGCGFSYLKPYIDHDYYDHYGYGKVDPAVQLNPVIVKAVKQFYDYTTTGHINHEQLAIEKLYQLYEAVFQLELKPTEIQQKWLKSFLYLIDILEYSYLPISYDCLKAIYDDIIQNGVAAIDLMIKEGISFGVELD